jgi:hypothetical protein
MRKHPLATKIKIISGKDFLEVTAAGIIDIATSRKLIVDVAAAETPAVDYELLVDFRDTRSSLSIIDLYQLAAELVRHRNTFRRKVALLVPPGVEFDQARFFETCAHNRGFSVNAFTDYEKAMHWVLSAETPPDGNLQSEGEAIEDR